MVILGNGNREERTEDSFFQPIFYLPAIPPCVLAKSLQSCPTLCDPMDCSLPDSSVHEVLRTRILEWVAMPSSRRSSQARGSSDLGLPHCRQVLYRMSHQGSPHGLCNKYMFVLEITPCSAYCCVARTLFEEHVFKTGILLLAYRSQM